MLNKILATIAVTILAILSISSVNATTDALLDGVSPNPALSPEQRKQQIQHKRDEWQKKRAEIRQNVNEKKDEVLGIDEKRQEINKEMTNKRRALYEEYKAKHKELIETIQPE